MKLINPILFAFLLATHCCHPITTKAATFTPLGDLPGGNQFSGIYYRGVSTDGSVVVGHSVSATGEEAFRWTRDGGMTGLGDLRGGPFNSSAYSVSGDGSVVVGAGRSASGIEAYRWTTATGMVGLGDLPGGDFESFSYGVSSDGSVVTGVATSASGYEAFRWTSDQGMVGLGDLPGEPFFSAAEAISDDGEVIVGAGNIEQPPGTFVFTASEAFRWTSDGGMAGLGDLPGGPFQSSAEGASADGSVIVGVANGDWGTEGAEAFRWTNAGGMVGLGDFPGGILSSAAWDVSADGSVIVGEGTTDLGEEAFRWTRAGGMQNLRELLMLRGVTELTDWTLNQARAISADGRAIAGFGTNPAGHTEAWLAVIAVPGDFNDNSAFDIADLDDLTKQSAAGNHLELYDLNADTLVNHEDVDIWIKDLFVGWIGDANLDQQFNSSDLVQVLAAGTYEADVAAVWSTGDFDGNGRFDSADLVAALADGGYEKGLRTAVSGVPEPASTVLFNVGVLGFAVHRRKLCQRCSATMR